MGLSKPGIIVDANVFHKFVTKHEDSLPIHKCIKKQKLKLVYGNDEKSIDEIKRSPKMKKMIRDLQRATYRVESKEMKEEIDCTRKINKTPIKSNDTHILAIALVEKKARLLFGGDTNLHKDFTDHRIINNPRGSIYQDKTHINLLP